MKEIGGYIELDDFSGKMLHDNAIKLNCARNALAYIIKAKKIKKILMPIFMCDSCDNVLEAYNVDVKYYHIGRDFKPINIQRNNNEFLYIVNYYGQLSDEYISSFGYNVIVDNTQAYFISPNKKNDTLYSCRKFFGVSDGAILYTDKLLDDSIERDESFERMHFLLGRYERNASEFYSEYVENNSIFNNEKIKLMSKLTENILNAVDYEKTMNIRTENFCFLHEQLCGLNKLNLSVPQGAFMYPLYIENGELVRKRLQERKIYIPILWPAVLNKTKKYEFENEMAKNILPLPVDQRYTIKDMKTVIEEIKKCMN